MGRRKPIVTREPGRRIFYCQRVPLSWKLDLSKPHGARINYVIAAWPGNRRDGTPTQIQSASFIKRHLASLVNRNHNLTQITIAIADDPKEPLEFTQYINSLPNVLSSASGLPTNIKILRRPNKGLAYGALVDSFTKYGAQFDYYILAEDDYVFCKNHFDRILVQMFRASPHCGYLASYIDKRSPTLQRPVALEDRPFIVIPNGITSAANLKRVVDKFGKVPYAENATLSVPYSSLPSLSFSSGFLETNKWLYDFQSFYRVPYSDSGKLQKVGSSQLDPLLLPIQHY